MKKLPTSFHGGPGIQGLPETEADQNRTPRSPRAAQDGVTNSSNLFLGMLQECNAASPLWSAVQENPSSM